MLRRDAFTQTGSYDDTTKLDKAIANAAAMASAATDKKQKNALALQDNAGRQPLATAQANSFNATADQTRVETVGKNLQNEVDAKTKMRKAEAITADLENASSVNIKNRDRMAEAAYKGALSDINYNETMAKARLKEVETNKMNAGFALESQRDITEGNARQKTAETRKKWQDRAESSVLGIDTQGVYNDLEQKVPSLFKTATENPITAGLGALSPGGALIALRAKRAQGAINKAKDFNSRLATPQ